VFKRTAMQLGSHAKDLLSKLRLKDRLLFKVRHPLVACGLVALLPWCRMFGSSWAATLLFFVVIPCEWLGNVRVLNSTPQPGGGSPARHQRLGPLQVALAPSSSCQTRSSSVW
jgi:hypothetical protein